MTSPLRDYATLAAVLDSAIADLADITFVVDIDGSVIAVNKVLLARSGLSRDQAVGQHFLDIIHGEDREVTGEHLHRALKGHVTSFRVVRTLDEETQYVSDVTLHPVRDGDEVVAVLGTARDVTEAITVARERESAEELLQIAGRMAGFGGWSMDANDRVLRLSDEARTILAIAPDAEIVLSALLDAQPSRTRDELRGAMRECLEEGRGFDLQLNIVTITGSQVVARILGRPERDHTGAVARALGAIWDVTEVEAEKAKLVELEERLTIALNTISDGIMFLDRDWIFTFANPRALELTGKSEAELLGKSYWEAFPESEGSEWEQTYRRALETGARQQVRSLDENRDTWFDITAYPTASGLALYVRDVTEDELTRQRMVANQRRLSDQARLLDASRDSMIVRGLDHRVQYWNRAATELYGWDAGEAIGQPITALIFDDTTAFDNATAAVLRDGFWSGALEQRARDGRSLVVDSRWQLVLDESGEPSAIFAVNSDITEQRKAEEARLRAQRMESLGTLAGGIAHDLNNVLTPILMSVQLLAQRTSDVSELQILGGIEDSVKRGADMIRQVLSFARGVEGRRIRVSVGDLLDDLALYARDALPDRISVTIERGDIDADTMGDPTQLLQVLINLVTNARDAMTGTGRLRIGARRAAVDERYTSVSHTAEPGDYVTIEIEDDGHGMPPAVVEKVFEPFFTTKGAGRGTGLGLANSLAIVRSHGGFMQAYSEEGKGSKFLVALPIVDTAQDAVERAARVDELTPHGSGELVLVIDDEPMILQVTAQTLESHGYRVLTARNGREALDIVDRNDQDIELVLTDMMMPVMDGAATSAYLEQHHPQIPIVAMSGLNSNGSVSRTVGMGITRFLPKPFTTSLLLTTVADTLRGVPFDHELEDES
ncbi:PAS domain-containing protein [Chryseoglobus sp. 28M-23]|uniref:hybrid sensor histidine kinase/response regulator n=1 Tax=Chryseoglobus sp. 28M-23 TaxID=2772253 RepID=UPI00174758DA|nr:PAS domain-containing protein [Chryseoglobus sp. 28M-23]QOD93012.1 PAS domain-containing protein [Chryseoglobus sp. 28M-23]